MPTLRYQALGPLLSGEGSRAFLGLEIVDEAEAQPVVLVWVPEDAAKDPKQRVLVERETARAVLLDHPNILRVAGLATLEEGWARVVEFADGEHLRKVLERVKRLPPEFAAKIAADAAMGVHFAHLAGNDDGSPLVHADLRPETLIVTFGGVTKVTGYGALCVAPRELGGQRVTGRRLHCAPEQIVSGREMATVQTDVYLLGLILYECLTGTIPFQDAPDFERAVLSDPLTFPESLDIPEALQQVVRRAMARKAPERYSSALEFREALQQAVVHLTPKEGLAAYLRTYFPEGEPARAARRRVIDGGIADFARKQWQKRPHPSESQEPAPATSTPASVPPRAPEVSRASAPAAPLTAAQRPPSPRTPPGPSLGEPPEPSSPHPQLRPFRWKPYAVAAGCVVGVALVIHLAFRTSSRKPTWEERIAANEPKPPPAAPQEATPSQVVDASVELASSDAGLRDIQGAPAGLTLPASATLPAVTAPSPVPDPPVAPAEPSSLSLVVDPPVDVAVDGEAKGRSPLELPLAPGRYKLTLSDKARGIQLVRSVQVRPTGKTVESISIGKGIVAVTAPPGALIAFDGRILGKAPTQSEFSLYEGAHRIVVTVSGATWQESFTLKRGERLYFDVSPE